MHNNRSISRELSLISLGLIKDKGDFKLNKFQIEEIFESALDSLINHCRDELDNCELELENASQKILDSELILKFPTANGKYVLTLHHFWKKHGLKSQALVG